MNTHTQISIKHNDCDIWVQIESTSGPQKVRVWPDSVTQGTAFKKSAKTEASLCLHDTAKALTILGHEVFTQDWGEWTATRWVMPE